MRATPRDDGRRQRVVILNWRDLRHPEGGGSELYVEQVAKRLSDRGVEVQLFCADYPGAPRRETRDGLTFVRRGGHLTVYLWAALYLLTRRFGVIDAVLEVQNGMPFLARLFTRARVVILVHHVHREQWPVVGPVLARVGWFLESRVAVLVNQGARYVAVSEVTKSELVDLGVRSGDVIVAYNGLPTRPAVTSRPTPEPRLAVLSRLVPHKQVEHAIRAVAVLAERYPTLQLDVMGSGWWESELKALISSLGLENRVTLHGHVTDTQKFEILAQSWVHVLPSLKEGWGLAIVEAASVYVPSVAYLSAGGVVESILDSVTGMLAVDEADLCTKIDLLLGDDSLRTDMGLKAAYRAEQFSWQTTAERVEGALLH